MPKSKPFLFSIILIILMAGCTLPIFNTENNESNTIESENAEEDEEIEDLQDSSETTAALPTETTTPQTVNLPEVKGEWTFYGNEPLRLERSEDIPKIILDQDGYLWFLGFGGIKKLDSALTDYVSYNPLGDDSEEILKELVVDSQNIIWAATDRQLFRLNGEEWESFEIPSSEEINDLAVGANDEIWVCSKDGVSRFSNDTWETFDTNRGLLENKCYVLSIDPDGNPWIVSQTNSLSHFVNHWEHYFVPDALVNSVEDDLIPTSFANIHIAPDGTIWVKGLLYNLIRFDGQEWHVEILSESEGRIDTFGLSAQGTPWMSAFDNYTRSSKFMAFDGENWINMMSGMYPKGILNTIFLDFAAAPDNSVWFLGEDMMVHKQLYDEDLFMDAHAYGSHTTNQGYTFLPDSSMYFAAENGLILNDPETRTTEIINSAGELISNQIKQMQVDKNGLVWIMVGQIGQNTSVQGFNGESWKTFFENQDFLSFIYDKYQTYWIYTNGGFLYKSSIVDGKTVFNMVKQEDGLLYHSLTQPFEDAEGNIWVGHNANVAAGASMWNGEEWQTFDCTDSNAPDCYGPEKFFNAPDGTLWAKIYSGGDPSPLNYFQNGEWYTLEGSEILQDGYSDLVFNKEGNPVVVYANDETNVLKEYNGPEDTTFWSTIDIPGEIASVAYQNNTLWVATKNDGLFYRIDSENEIGELLPADNVPWESEKLNVLKPDNHGNLWLGTNGGVYLYTYFADPSNPNQFQGIWQSFDEIEESGFGYVHTIEIDPSGDIWFASTSQGVAKFDYP